MLEGGGAALKRAERASAQVPTAVPQLAAGCSTQEALAAPAQRRRPTQRRVSGDRVVCANVSPFLGIKVSKTNLCIPADGGDSTELHMNVEVG